MLKPLALALFMLPLALPAQTLIEDTPGPYALLAFPAYISDDWQPLRDLFDAEYGDGWTTYSDQDALNAARNAGGAQASLFEGEDRTLLAITDIALPQDLQAELMDYFPMMTAQHMQIFDRGVSLAAIDYDDGTTVVTLALLGARDQTMPDVAQVSVLINNSVPLALPDGSSIETTLVQETGAGTMEMSITNIPLAPPDAAAYIAGELLRASLTAIPTSTEPPLGLMVMGAGVMTTLSIDETGQPGLSQVTFITVTQ